MRQMLPALPVVGGSSTQHWTQLSHLLMDNTAAATSDDVLCYDRMGLQTCVRDVTSSKVASTVAAVVIINDDGSFDSLERANR